jgi:hypothetical protein
MGACEGLPVSLLGLGLGEVEGLSLGLSIKTPLLLFLALDSRAICGVLIRILLVTFQACRKDATFSLGLVRRNLPDRRPVVELWR